jgi:hypothetical protein
LIGAWPASRLRRAIQLDTRLNLADRLATAWLDRTAATPMADLQRADALRNLQALAPEKTLRYRVGRLELAALAALTILTLALLVTKSAGSDPAPDPGRSTGDSASGRSTRCPEPGPVAREHAHA